MNTYYSLLTLVTVTGFLVLLVLTLENHRLPGDIRRRFSLGYIVISLAALAEYFSVYLNGKPDWTKNLHLVVKCLDYILTPLVGMMLVLVIYTKKRWIHLLVVIIVGNATLQVCSLFTGWMYYIDEANCYHHGPCYPVYCAFYLVVLLVSVFEFWMYGRRYEKRNQPSLFLILTLLLSGIAVQEISNGSLRVCYITILIGLSFLYIHYHEFVRQDDELESSLQQRLLETDALTGLKNRYAYNQEVEKILGEKMPQDIYVCMLDVNGLKEVNDNLGHPAGDELIRGVADCIRDSFSGAGDVFRVGGDEFVAILRLEEGQMQGLCEGLEGRIKKWHGKLVDHVGLSYGYASAKEFPEDTLEQLVHVADQRMYEQKALFYSRFAGTGEYQSISPVSPPQDGT